MTSTKENEIEIRDYDALLAKLWYQPEGKGIDFKEPFVFGKPFKKEMYGLIKDILAMANTVGGGYIIIGKKDKERRAVDCSQEVLESFDPTEVHNNTKKYGRPEPKYSINEAISPENTTAIIICIDEFEEHVVICSKNADCEQNKKVLRAGAVYIRSKTEDATSAQVILEQDMRSLIDRSIFKSRNKLTRAFEGVIGDYLKGMTQNRVLKEDHLHWQKDEEFITELLDTKLPLKGHMLQIVAHPENFDVQRLCDGKILRDKLTASIDIHKCWSFPCLAFELRELEVPSETKEIIVSSSRPFLRWEQQAIFGLRLSGLMIYREELPTAYDEITSPGKPLLMGWPLLSIYRAISFFGRFYECVPGNEKLRISILITDTHNRYPAVRVSNLNHLGLFYNADGLSHPKLNIDFEKERSEFTNNINQTYTELFRQLLDVMEVEVSNEQLQVEVDKIASSH